MKKRYNYRIYPTTEQKDELEINFGCSRFIYNYFVSLNKNQYKDNKTFNFYNTMSSMLTLLKKQDEYLFLKKASSVALQQSLIHLDRALKDCGVKVKNRKEFPKYKSCRDKQSFSIVGDGYFGIRNNKLWLTKVGLIDVKWSRDLPSKPSSLTVIKNKAGQYHVSFVVEVESKILPKTESIIGIDLGIETFATTSNGTKYKLPDLTRLYKNVKRKQQDLNRTKKGSKNKEKCRLKLAKIYLKIVNKREDFHNKLVSTLVNENQVIVVESLKVKQMMKTKSLARMISCQGWNTFITKLDAKCIETGRLMYSIGQYIPTSQVCSSCGFKWGKLDLKIRRIQCNNCLEEHDRDINAAKNILHEYNRR